ncbi:PSD1 and planctomycete cytochrome C domain-containing protein [Neorhodopirellula pilleata]|uniref:PSD1 and planctomycete cytochrome C domain-containing protein n=1 Tax=Neorhodopirellula pilleata TaxID=2714738 RepID=UPI001E5041D9|nr:PSD1 and planctomycete cytochrome C domain-containing protein [Neorhodopirellula pilleata]
MTLCRFITKTLPTVTLIVAIGVTIVPTLADGLNPKEEFFEQKIRPLLIDRCHSCHDASLQESDLRLDSRDGVLQGGVSGAAVIAGNPAQSLLIHAVTGTRNVERMPPDEPLEESEIALLRRWINMGAPWTAQDAPAPVALGDQEAIGRAAETHWAFQPISHPTPPDVTSIHLPAEIHADQWKRNPIDAFVLSRLADSGLSPSPSAQRDVLLRRLSFDLIGLPPTHQQVQSFVNDPRPDPVVIEETVDRLLASEHHGERWARYWLDLARYADTRDWQAQAEIRYPYAYTYRDYVINSLNDDKPYNEFIQEQIAADYYYQQPDAPELAALGFLTVGPLFRNDRLEQAADKIDVVGRGLMGITISCARCHDHKYDPIPIEDYYSLYGVFASCSTPDTYPTIDSGMTDEALLADFEKALAEKQNDLRQYKIELRRDAILDLQERIPTYFDAFVVMGIDKKKEIRGIKSQFNILESAMTPLNNELLARLKRNRDKNDAVGGPWHDALSISEPEFKKQRTQWLNRWLGDADLNPLIAETLKQSSPLTRSDVVKAYAGVIERVMKKTLAVKPLDANEEAIRAAMLDEGGWFDFDPEAVANASRLMGKGRKMLGDLDKAITEVESTHPGAPPRAMTLVDNEKPVTPFVMLRGEANRRGDQVPRQFVSILSPEKREPFVDGSGRRELAEAITSPTNSLTTRVLVNRIWSKYFGVGLAGSLDDFGLRSEPPSHPELLDYLASEFMANGWSMKWLHKTIATSQTYAQSSDFRDEAMRADPDNRLIWRQSRRRLDFEAMRDSILCASGAIDRTVGGKSIKLSEEPFTTRRSVYAYVDRIELDPILRTFDFASPTASAASRPETTIPQQALFGMNHPFVAQQARRIANQAEDAMTTKSRSSDEVIKQLYQNVFARSPSDDELKIAKEFLATSADQAGAMNRQVWQYGFGALTEKIADSSVESGFEPLPHWTGQFYQASDTYPDPDKTFLRLTETGGHPGRDNHHAVIRRWIAPQDGAVNVNGRIKHSRDKGDGVIAAVRCNDVFETFQVCQGEAQTLIKQIPVQAGDAIDFIVAPGETTTADSYTWMNLVVGVKGNLAGQTWRSNTDFAAPPPPALTPLAQLAQALLLTNEFLYLD